MMTMRVASGGPYRATGNRLPAGSICSVSMVTAEQPVAAPKPTMPYARVAVAQQPAPQERHQLPKAVGSACQVFGEQLRKALAIGTASARE